MEDNVMTSNRAKNMGSITSRIVRACAVFASLVAVSACEEPKQDKFRSEGGISPDPVGVITGSVAYLGPQPSCEYDDKGRPTRIIGRVILTLFEYDNPSPPEGRATSAVNLLIINGDKLFTLEDCRPQNTPVNPNQRITRSVDYRWTNIALRDVPVDYQIRGFYDADEDMIPFFRVTNLPTAGDVAGGAVRDFLAPEKGFLPVSMPAAKDARDGFIRPNVTVGLNTFIWTERPIFKLPETNRFLSSDEHVPAVPNLAAAADSIPADVVKTLDATWELSKFSIVSLTEDETKEVFTAGGIQYDFDPQKQAFYVAPVDVKTIVPGKPDVTLPDGVPDPHPVLGATTSLDLDWYQPMVLVQRTPWVPNYDPNNADSRAALQNAIAVETAAKIPSVLLVGTPLLSEIEVDRVPMLPEGDPDESGTKRTFHGNINIAIPPVAVVDLDPSNPLCRVPYIPYGRGGDSAMANDSNRTSTRSYESRVTECQDLPTGMYGVNVLSGIAGGALVAEPDDSISENGFVAEGTRFSSQVWSLPNELGDPAQVGAGKDLESQGYNHLFVVYDPDLESDARRRAAAAEGTDQYCTKSGDPDMGIAGILNPREIRFKGICAKDENPFAEDAEGVDSVNCLPDSCCDAVRHLCGVKLCPAIEVAPGRHVRTSPTGIAGEGPNGQPVPDCIPFVMPRLCCGDN